MTLVKDTLKKYDKLWSNIRDLIRSTSNNLDNYDKKYKKIKFNSDDDLTLKEKLEHYNMIMVVRSIFHESNKYYPQVFLDECLYKLSASRAEYYINVRI